MVVPFAAGFFAVAATEGGVAVPSIVISRENESARCRDAPRASANGWDSGTAAILS